MITYQVFQLKEEVLVPRDRLVLIRDHVAFRICILLNAIDIDLDDHI